MPQAPSSIAAIFARSTFATSAQLNRTGRRGEISQALMHTLYGQCMAQPTDLTHTCVTLHVYSVFIDY